jgi:hypothetical protein
MEVVHTFKIFKMIFYFKFLELAKVIFGPVKVWMSSNFKFEFVWPVWGIFRPDTVAGPTRQPPPSLFQCWPHAHVPPPVAAAVGLLPVSRHPTFVVRCHPPPPQVPLPQHGTSVGPSPTSVVLSLKGCRSITAAPLSSPLFLATTRTVPHLHPLYLSSASGDRSATAASPLPR